MRMKMLAACLGGLLSVGSLVADPPKKSCCARERNGQQGQAVKAEKLRCSVTGQVVDTCCCVQREGKLHCTLAGKDVETCCCQPVSGKNNSK